MRSRLCLKSPLTPTLSPNRPEERGIVTSLRDQLPGFETKPGLLALVVLFACSVIHPALGQQRADETLEQRLVRLERMTDAEKTSLLQKKRRFEELSGEDQKRMHDLHKKLSADAQADRLRAVLVRYHAWLRTLSPGEYAEIIRLPVDQRIPKIKELMKTQEAKRFRMMVDGRLSQDDLRTIREWLGEFIEAHESEILAALPADKFGEFRKNYDPEKHRRFLTFMMFRHDAPNVLRPSTEDIEKLPPMLSREARDFLAKAGEEDGARIIQNWIRAAVFSRSRPPVSPEELKRFVAEKLDARQREYLESLPLDRMHAELQRLYFMDRFGRYGGGRFGDPARRKFPGSGRGPGGRARSDGSRGLDPGSANEKGPGPRGRRGRGSFEKGEQKSDADRADQKADKASSSGGDAKR